MLDVAFGSLLVVANLVVTWLNALAWDETGERRDMCATLAWAGSTCYWLVRVVVALQAAT